MSCSQSYGVDVWALTCVLVHCLSGEVVWLSRFGHVPALHYIVSCACFLGAFCSIIIKPATQVPYIVLALHFFEKKVNY